MNNDWREYQDELYHHGIKGQKWGVRRFQNADGSLTSAGRAHYGDRADKVEKKLTKATSWENKAVNSKTRLGRSISTDMAVYRRQQADKQASKGEGDYKALAINKNASRNSAARAEANANIAAGLKDKASGVSDKKHERIMNEAVKRLATAENAEIGAKSYKTIADTKGLKKGAVAVKETIRRLDNTYTSAGRQSRLKDKALEAVGDAVLNEAFKITVQNVSDNNEIANQVASKVNFAGTTKLARDAVYRHQNSADKRWNKVMNG
jgi:hypothetical protein